MATLTLTLTPSSAAPGSTVTATYDLTGTDTEDRVLTVTGGGTLDGQPLGSVTGSFTLAHQKTFATPTAPGMTFQPTADPKVFTATVPAA